MKKKSILLLVLALLMAFSLSACGDKEDTEKGTEDNMLKTALTNMNEAESLTYSMEMNMKMTSDDGSMDMTTTGAIEQIVDPVTMKMDMTMSFAADGADAEKVTTTSYTVTEGDSLITYTDNGDGTWYKQTVGDSDLMAQYDATETINMYFSKPDQFTEARTEEVNGSKATKFEGTLTEENINDALESSGVLSMLDTSGEIDEETLKSLYEGIGDMPISIWVDNETVLPVKYEMDMTNMMQAIVGKVMESSETESANITFDKMYMSMLITDYNTVTSIELPAEAANAEDITNLTTDTTTETE